MAVKSVWSIVKPLIKPAWKFSLYTGLILPIGLWGLSYCLEWNTPGFVYGIVCLISLAWCIQNIIRFAKQDSSFSILKAVSKKQVSRQERNFTNPSVAAEYKSNEPQGFMFGKKGRDFVVKKEDIDGHILGIGGAGSGKSSCIAIPTLMAWSERVFAIDIKGELSQKTNRVQAKIFNPSDLDSYGYDPYYMLRHSENKVQDAKEIAMAIVPKPVDIKEPFWIEGAQNILTGAILHYEGQGMNFIQTIEQMQITPVQELINEIHESSVFEARMFVNQLVGMDIKTLAGIFTELSNKTMMFATDKKIKHCLSKSQVITPADLDSGFDIFISIEESKLEQWKELLNLIVNQFLKYCERRNEQKATPILFLLDEFARLGKVETVINGLATLRSKKVTICILTQSLAQLDAIYGKPQRQVIADNCQFKAILNATDADTQEYFSKLVGTYDKTKKTQSANFEQYTKLGKGTGVSKTTEEKRIIKPEEFARLTDIVLLTPKGFYRVDKAPYYQEKKFKQGA